MVVLSFSHAVAVTLGALLLGTVLCWTLSAGKKSCWYHSAELTFWQCSICLLVYSVAFKEEMSRCPQCHSINKIFSDQNR